MTAGVPFPSNPIPVGRDCGEDCRGCKARDRWSEGWTAADSWWRSRLVSDETLAARLEAAERLLVAFAAEEDEHGFPFSFELRDAHRALVAATDRDKPGQRPWATDEDYAAEHAEKPECEDCGGDKCDEPCGEPMDAAVAEKPETDT